MFLIIYEKGRLFFFFFTGKTYNPGKGRKIIFISFVDMNNSDPGIKLCNPFPGDVFK